MRLASWNPDDPVACVVDRIDLEVLARSLIAACAEDYPEFAALREDVVEGPLLGSTRVTATALLRMLVERRQLSAAEIEELLRAHRHLLVWGIPIADVIGAWSTAMPRLWQELTLAARAHELAPLLEAGVQIFGFTGFIPRLAQLYMDDYDAQLVLEERAAAQQLAAVREEPLGEPYVVVPAGDDPLAHARLAHDMRKAGLLAVTRPGRIEGLKPADAALDVPPDALLVVSGAHPDRRVAHEIGELSRTAAVAARLGRRGTIARDRFFAELMLDAAPVAAAEIRARIVAPLVGDPATNGDLLRAARAFVRSDFSRSGAAAALGLPASTLRGRLSRIAALSGLDLGHPIDRCLLALAVKADAAADSDLTTRNGERRTSPRPTYSTQLVRAIGKRVDLDNLADLITAAHREQLPSFAALPRDTGQASIRLGIRAGLDDALALLVDERAPDEVELKASDERLGREMELGVTPDDALKGIGIAGQMLWQALLGAATPEELAGLSAVPAQMLRHLGGISRAARGSARSAADASVEQANQALFELLADPAGSRGRIEELAGEIGVREDRPWTPVVALPAAGQAPGLLAVGLRSQALPAATLGDRVHALAPADRGWRPPPPPTLAVVGAPCTRWDEMPGAFAAASAIAAIARRRGLEGTVSTAQFPLELLVTSSPALAERLLHAVMGPLEEHAHSGLDLVGTLCALVAHAFDRRGTAAALHLHPNSITYRLRRIVELTGLDPARGDDLVTLVLGVTAHRLGRAAV